MTGRRDPDGSHPARVPPGGAGESPGGTIPDDAELLRRHVHGDHDAFGVLFSRHRDRLWAVAVRTLGDREEASDALQEGMISAFRRADGFRGDCAVTTWLHRIVVNACLDRLRRRAARPTAHGLDEETLEAVAAGRPVTAATVDSDVTLDVLAALRTLPPEQRAALVLVDMLGYPVADAAQVLDVSVGTVKSRCARGRARLLPRLAHLRGTPRAAAGPDQPPLPPAMEPGPAAMGNLGLPPSVSPAEGGGQSQS